MKAKAWMLLVLLFSLWKGMQAQDNELKVFQLNRDGYNIKASAYVQPQKIKVKDDRTYFWIKARQLHYSQGGFEGNLLHGEFVEFYYSEQIKEKGNFKNGLKDGVWKNWYESGVLKEVITWNEGVMNGPFQSYDQQGKLIKEGVYKNGKLDGTVKEIDSTGTVKEVKFKNGKEKQAKVRRKKKGKEPEIVPMTEQGKAEETKEKKKWFSRKKKNTETPQQEEPKKEEPKKEKKSSKKQPEKTSD